MSHELRTPLNAILGFTQLLERDPAITADQRENLRTIAQSGQHLLMLINDVLEMSKIEAGRTSLHEESFDLYRMLEMLEDMFYLRAKEKGLQLLFERAPDVPRYIWADEGKLRQILINLLSNAVKFTQPERAQQMGGVVMRIGALSPDSIGDSDTFPSSLWEGSREDEGDEAWKPESAVCLLFEVEDTGPGIPPEDLPYLFDPFVQTASGLESKEGTGLGLPISQQFVKLMHGEITVRSELGHGSTFRVIVPVELADASDVPVERPLGSRGGQRRVIGIESGQQAPDGGPYRLLIVEDKALNRRLMLKLLEPFGFELREAVNGQEAVEIWQAWHPHLIWMDMRMPVMDGHEATKRIKQLQAISERRPCDKAQALQAKVDTIIIALTASAFEEDRRVILDEGCDGFVRKPFRETDIFETLAEHLDIRFVYDEEEPDLEARSEPPMDELMADLDRLHKILASLPSHWRLDLREAAMQADSGVILDLLGRVGAQHASLNKALRALVRDFRFDIIMELASMEDRE
jgi:CheY-like chemotaxis protein